MNLTKSGFILVLFVILETISGLALDKSNVNNHTQDLIVTEKSQQDNGATDSVSIIVPTVHQTTVSTITSATTNNATTPSTLPPIPSTTTPAPAPAPAPNSGPWVIKYNNTDIICIIAEMSMQLNITYPAKNESQLFTLINIPKNATVQGSCSKPTQTMVISWETDNNLKINFSASETTKNFYVSGLSLEINATVFKDRKVGNQSWSFQNTSSEFSTPLEMSYKCNKVQDLNLKSVDDKINAVLSLKDTQLQAFMNKTEPNFEAAQNCDTFDTPDIVPIAVGCALAILVLVVLVAYLIGRKRSQNRGYLSM